MDEKTAGQLAAIVGGEAWQSGGDIWLVTVHREDGRVVVFGGDSVAEYEDDEAFDEGRSLNSINVSIAEADELYVIVDQKGNVYYRDDKLERGWLHEEEAEHEAMAWESRGEGKFQVMQKNEVDA